MLTVYFAPLLGGTEFIYMSILRFRFSIRRHRNTASITSSFRIADKKR